MVVHEMITEPLVCSRSEDQNQAFGGLVDRGRMGSECALSPQWDQEGSGRGWHVGRRQRIDACPMISRTALYDFMKKLEARKGPFTFFGLFMREDSPNLWDLVVSAPWLGDADLDTLRKFINELADEFGEAELMNFSRVVTLTPRDESLRRILDEVGTVRKPIEKTGVDLFGLPVREAHILKARRPRIAA
jgi:hypothetical protein